ncbi:hypothetical protein PS2015_2950 [Pseudohongiella spirulinae]|uniref:Uncharacterized protein n=1 Tax=Pseudohongiella spirulinae TaxID=1249552 RepID=A0A0S2KH48_9GAMM|nr:hypothetical protein PS2015_2950 [Pseudohongiella spirulinae]
MAVLSRQVRVRNQRQVGPLCRPVAARVLAELLVLSVAPCHQAQQDRVAAAQPLQAVCREAYQAPRQELEIGVAVLRVREVCQVFPLVQGQVVVPAVV